MSQRKRCRVPKKNIQKQKSESSYWKITAVVVIIFCVGLIFKVMFATQPVIAPNTSTYQPVASGESSIDLQIRQVAANFSCACGGCGELPLVECTCDMPKGAVEEKRFIRKKLGEGLSVGGVIDLVDAKYGYRKS